MVERWLLEHPWLPALLWLVLYSSDYYLTLLGAKLREGQKVFQTEGSYELTPQYQQDVDERRKLSPRFIVWLLYGAAMLLIPWITGFLDGMAVPYGILVGLLIVPELVVHTRHIDNILFYRDLNRSDCGMTGSVLMPRRQLYLRSSVQLWATSGLVLCLSALTYSPVLLGGAVGVAVNAHRHRRLAMNQKMNPEMVETNDTNDN